MAKEIGIELVRFDMSEYTEKHTVAKLIGSPAGYSVAAKDKNRAITTTPKERLIHDSNKSPP